MLVLKAVWNARTQISDISQIIVAFSWIENLYLRLGGVLVKISSDGAFRLLVKHCDKFQRLQMMHDTTTFWGLLTCFPDFGFSRLLHQTLVSFRAHLKNSFSIRRELLMTHCACKASISFWRSLSQY
ncbi:uncharacterized protein BJ212DRAFT_1341365 [Suillus subaureus]|uniref:Uncharacterized protein n=1 Tax=Suillus subaureus TaxID=48587 RepID=A0A9P7JF50_9AGAM|nr:uncharacterized protein BJ212DRAFT_1341365 [Suillus subaureus]KAG1819516.1 hypothetical protein BJ212DRAFT_1341365 [Suillus subaureus]